MSTDADESTAEAPKAPAEDHLDALTPEEVEGAAPAVAWMRWLWVLPIAVAVAELLGFGVIQARVVQEADWRRAAEFVEPRIEEGDLLVSAPEWTDPMLRLVLGEHIDLSAAGRSDLAPFSRIWVLSIRGFDAREAPVRGPDFDEMVGPVRIRRWDLGPSPVIYDFVKNIQDASVTIRRGGTDAPCPFRRARADARGLNQGPATPAERHQCSDAGWLWTGATINEDLHLQNRYCIWQHPSGLEPVTATFEDVPLGERMVFYAGLYYNHEHPRDKSDVMVTVRVNGEAAGRVVHADGDGWKRFEVLPRTQEQAESDPEARGTVSVEVTAHNPHFRSLCWAGTVRQGPRNEVRVGEGAQRR